MLIESVSLMHAQFVTIIIDDSPTPPWVAAMGRDALAVSVGGRVVEVEGPATVPALATCEAMRRSM